MKTLKSLAQYIRSCLDERNILIYQMGKVGSTAVEVALKNSTHFHTLYGRRCCEFLSKNMFPTKNAKLKHYLLVRIRRFLYVRRKKVKIITLVRNPYERNVSHFFQDLPYWLSYHIRRIKGESRSENPTLLAECFEESFNFDYGKYWFKEEIERLTGVSISDIDFNVDAGFGVVKKGKYEVLFLRMDKLNTLEAQISQFVGSEIVISRVNSGGAKWYKSLYLEFKASYAPSNSVIQKTFDSEWVQKFFSKTEIETMKHGVVGAKASNWNQ